MERNKTIHFADDIRYYILEILKSLSETFKKQY